MIARSAACPVSRRAVLQGAALTVGFALAGRARSFAQGTSVGTRVLDPKQVDAFLASTPTTPSPFLRQGRSRSGPSHRHPQIAAEELGIGIDKIRYVEGDTARTPDQGRTSGSNGIQRGGVQICQAAATARKRLVELAAERLNVNVDDLIAIDGQVRPKAGGAGIRFADLLDGRRLDLPLDAKAPLKQPATYTLVGKSLPRPDVPAKCTGSFIYMQDFRLPGMLHARVIRPQRSAPRSLRLTSLDQGSPGARVVRSRTSSRSSRTTNGQLSRCASASCAVEPMVGPAGPGDPCRNTARDPDAHRRGAGDQGVTGRAAS